jgi:hypothetical protein
MASEKEDLALRKLRAETARAELELERSQVRHRNCRHCGGAGYFSVGGSYFDNRCGKPHREGCRACRGSGRVCVHPSDRPCVI